MHCINHKIKLIDDVPSHLPIEILPHVPPVTPPSIEDQSYTKIIRIIFGIVIVILIDTFF